ncbi:hypothetical protein ANN_26512 [Periplaneta americana]|uniref:Reverse transcriptase domain-containing protein n=1 Tax=Periplaneta americana TaxID=6978 RepID=A0ABQ8RYD9_PERAM|nr:hypothetical protein ANN_26512 [Periplaneta americana]
MTTQVTTVQPITGSYGLARSMWTSVPRKKSVLSRLRTSHNIRNIAEDEIIGDHQCGFRRNRSNIDQIFCIPQILDKKCYDGWINFENETQDRQEWRNAICEREGKDSGFSYDLLDGARTTFRRMVLRDQPGEYCRRNGRTYYEHVVVSAPKSAGLSTTNVNISPCLSAGVHVILNPKEALPVIEQTIQGRSLEQQLFRLASTLVDIYEKTWKQTSTGKDGQCGFSGGKE